jgi:uncharacterized protein (DUF1800 family)/fibronectin type 3 domain-containing protein
MFLSLTTGLLHAQQQPVTGTGTGLKGAYYNNATLNGIVSATRTDTEINFTWGQNPPNVAGITGNRYSVRWTGVIQAPVTGEYSLHTRSDDGVRLWVNRKLLINHWTNHGATWDQAVPLQLTAGQKYDIQLEYFEDYGNAVIQLYWSHPGQPIPQVVPRQYLYPGDVSPLQPSPPVSSRVWVSDLNWISAINGDGAPKLDLSSGSKAMTIAGRRYRYGIGAHARSEITYPLDDRFDLFRAVIGIDDEVGDQGSVVFEVWLDGRMAYQSPQMRGSMGGRAIEVPVENARQMRLVVNSSGSSNPGSDHADWADARLEGVEPVRYLSDLNWTSATNGDGGKPEKNQPFGGPDTGEGSRIRLLGSTYRKGIGTLAVSEIQYKIDRRYELFSSVVGIDDFAKGPGSVVFEVWNGNTKLWNSPMMKRGDPVRHVSVPVSTVDTLTLRVLNGGDGNTNDLGVWADAKLLPIGTDFAIPSAPTGLDADPGNGRVTLKWNPVSNATSYRIYRSTSSGGQSENNVIAASVRDLTYVDRASNGTKYFYKVKAVNPSGASGFSNEDFATPSPVEDVPAAPRGLDATAGLRSVTLKWNETAGATSYNVYRGNAPNAQATNPIATNIKTLTYANTGLTPGVRYFYKIKAVNKSGMSAYSGEDSAMPTGSSPNSPAGLDATAGIGEVKISWTKAADADHYTLYRSTTSPVNDGATAIATRITANTFTDTRVTNGTKYFYRAKAGNAWGTSTFSNEDSATPAAPVVVPAAPSGVSALGGDAAVLVSWRAVPGALSYKVYRSTTSNGQAEPAFAMGLTGLEYRDTKVTNNTRYFYKVAAVNTAGQSPMSAEAAATPEASLTAPTGLTATGGDRTVRLTWNAVNGAAKYNVYRGTAVIATVTSPAHTDTNLTNGTKYFYKVSAVNAANAAGPMSSEVSATPEASLAAPAGLTAAGGNARVTLAWTAVPGASKYNIYRGTAPNGQSPTPVGTVSETTFVNSGLTNGTKYYYKVAAVTASNSVGPVSAEASATPEAPLPAPSNLKSDPGDREVILTWNPVPGATKYNVYRGTAAGAQAGTAIAAGIPAATYTNTGLTNGTAYFYKVTAVSATNVESPQSGETSATPAPILPAPGGLTATPANQSITLNWTAVTGATAYNVYRGTATGQQNATPLTRVTATTYANTGLTNGTTYFYTVAAVNANNDVGTRSAEVSSAALAPPSAPTGLTATPGNTQITLSWTAGTGAATYNLYVGNTTGAQATTPVATGITATTFLHTGLTNGTNYFYRVTSVNASGESTRSNEATTSPEGSATTVDPATLSAFRLLRHATWGPKPGDVERVKQIGRTAFLNEQFNAPVSEYPDPLFDSSVEVTAEHFMRLAINGPDQLRQRVAWALHKIWVISAVQVDRSDAIVTYKRILLNRAFGNYRDLMRDISLNPGMGAYLNMLNNRSQAITNAPPNENYAREILQLFTLGLTRLNRNGTPVLDAQGRPVSTYTEDDVENLARVFTGWTYGDGNPATVPTNLAGTNFRVPMEAVDRFHDTGAKTVLGAAFPPGRNTNDELNAALDLIFNHSNLPPFVSKLLIQNLVTSNPSPAYVDAVAQVFENNGSGVRGDLRAVVRAILEHPDAGGGSATKLMEPALFVISQVRALGSSVADHPFMTDLSEEMGQKIFYPPSVFSYFSPGYRIRGTTLGGPEFQILTAVTALSRVNYVGRLISGGFGSDVTLNLTEFNNRAADPAGLADYCNVTFMGGLMSAEHRAEIINAVRVMPASNPTERVRTALYLTLASAQYQVER